MQEDTASCHKQIWPCTIHCHSLSFNCMSLGSYICKRLSGLQYHLDFICFWLRPESYPLGRSLSSVVYWGSYCARELLDVAPNSLAQLPAAKASRAGMIDAGGEAPNGGACVLWGQRQCVAAFISRGMSM